MASDDRSKLSWREIDKRRESGRSDARPGGGGGGSGRGLPPTQEEARQKQYRAALEAAFERGELGKLADKLNLVGRGGGPTATPAPVAAAPAAPSQSSAAAVADGGAAVATGAVADGAAVAKGGKKKVPDDRLSLRKKLVEAVGRGEISRAAEKFLTRFPLPDDHEVLEQMLEHERESRVNEAIARIAVLLDRNQLPKRSRALCGKLKYISETTHDSELRQAAQGLLSRLG